jgi:hypothetical protein
MGAKNTRPALAEEEKTYSIDDSTIYNPLKKDTGFGISYETFIRNVDPEQFQTLFKLFMPEVYFDETKIVNFPAKTVNMVRWSREIIHHYKKIFSQEKTSKAEKEHAYIQIVNLRKELILFFSENVPHLPEVMKYMEIICNLIVRRGI